MHRISLDGTIEQISAKQIRKDSGQFPSSGQNTALVCDRPNQSRELLQGDRGYTDKRRVIQEKFSTVHPGKPDFMCEPRPGLKGSGILRVAVGSQAKRDAQEECGKEQQEKGRVRVGGRSRRRSGCSRAAAPRRDTAGHIGWIAP